MRKWIISYGAALVAMLALDIVWLGATAQPLYRAALGDLLAADFRAAPAIAFYFVYIAGLVILAIRPQSDDGGWSGALARGAIYGLCAYATYDLTNQATLKHWSTTLTLIDMAWGSFLSAFAASVGAAAARRFAGPAR